MTAPSPRPAVGDLVRTPRGEGRVVQVEGEWMTVEIDLCGFVDTAVVRAG